MAPKFIKLFHQFIDYLAFIISAVFSPYITAGVFIIIISYYFSNNLSQFLPWMLTFLFFAVIVPGVYVLWLIETKKIRDIHINFIGDRKFPFLLAGLSSAIGAILLFILGAAKPVATIGTIYAVNVIAIAFLTQVWKISVHTALYTSVVTIITILFGINFWWLYLILIPLMWSRVHRQRHTIWQTVAGSLLAFVLTSATFWIFGYF